MRYALKVIYDGTEYCGWQRQANGITVQQVLEDAAYAAFNRKINITASGRTDSGVHALGQVCHMDTDVQMPGEKVADALNAYLPANVCVAASCAAPAGFDANRSAKKKTYCYNLYFSPRRNPLRDRYAVWVKGVADIGKMKKGASLFVGEHDFKAYCSSGSQVLTTVRTVYSVNVEAEEKGGETLVKISVCGSGFLYNMVRTMVGTIYYYSAGRLTEEDILNSLKLGERSLVGKTMPPNGLVLESVDYGVKLF